MKIFRHSRAIHLLLAICLMMQGTLANANPQRQKQRPRSNTPRQIKIVDVALDAKGTLTGSVYSATGNPLPSEEVRLMANQREVAKAATSKDGRFRFRNVRAGVHQLHTKDGVVFCRLWTKNAAPPKAAKGILIVHRGQLARGQHPISELFLSDPVLVGSIVAAAIVVPVVIHEAREDDPSGS